MQCVNKIGSLGFELAVSNCKYCQICTLFFMPILSVFWLYMYVSLFCIDLMSNTFQQIFILSSIVVLVHHCRRLGKGWLLQTNSTQPYSVYAFPKSGARHSVVVVCLQYIIFVFLSLSCIQISLSIFLIE